MPKDLRLDGDNLGIIHAKKNIEGSTIWLTEKPDGTWWVVVKGQDESTRVAGFINAPQERRARDTYNDLSMPHVLATFLAGVDS